MVTGIENIIPNSTAVTPPTAVPPTQRPTINPAQDRRTGDDRRDREPGQEQSTFKAALNTATGVGEKFAADASLNARKAIRQAAAAKLVRADKQPKRGSIELGADESERLYAQRQAERARTKRDDIEQDAPVVVPSSPEFIEAASRYAERFFSVKGPLAKPGESLELTA